MKNARGIHAAGVLWWDLCVKLRLEVRRDYAAYGPSSSWGVVKRAKL